MKKLLLLFVAAFVCMAVSAAQYVNVIGEFNSWTDNGLSPGADGITKHTNLNIGTSVFKIKTWDGVDAYYSTGGAIPQNQWVTINGNNDANMTISGATDGQCFDVEWNWNTHQIRVTPVSGDPQPTVASWCIHGNVETGEWKDITLTESNGKWIAGPLTWKVGEFGIKKVENGTQTEWWSAPTSSPDLVLDTPMTLVKTGNTNIKVKSAGTYYITFDPATHVLKASGSAIGGGDDPTPSNYDGWYVNVLGTYNGWVDNGVTVPADGLTKHEGLQIGTNGFKIKIWNGTENLWYSNGTPVAQGSWVTVDADLTDMPCMTVEGAEAGDIFTVEYNVATNKVMLTKTGNQPVNDEVTYSIRGNFVTGEWADLNLTENNGKWEVNNVACVAGEFGVKKNEGGVQVNWFAASEAVTVSETTSLTLMDGDNTQNIKIAAGTYSFSFDPATLVLAITKDGGEPVNPGTDWANFSMYLRGNFNGWGYDENADKMTWNGTAYTITKASLEGQFAFAGADWNHKFNYTGVTIDGPAKDMIVDGGGNDHNFDTAGTLTNVTFTLNPETKVLTVTADGGNVPDPVNYDDWYVNISGEFNGWAANGVHPDANGISKHEGMQIGTEGFKVHVYDGTDDIWYSTGEAVAQGSWVNIDADEMSSMTVAGAEAGDIFTVEFNVVTKEVKLTKTGNQPVNEEVTYCIHGNIVTGGWADLNLTENNGMWEAVDVECIAGEFGVKKNVGGIQKAWYSADASTTVSATTTINLVEDGSNNIALVAGTYSFSLDPANMVLTITTASSGIEGVEAGMASDAVYYNLQGIRVANPVEGKVYIRVEGGKAVKVIR